MTILATTLMLAGCGGGDGPERGELVSFEPTTVQTARCGTTGTVRARVIGVAGDEVEIRSGSVYVNGEPADYDVETSSSDSTPAVTVPDEQLFVLGDDRASACDSRVWGFLPVGNVE